MNLFRRLLNALGAAESGPQGPPILRELDQVPWETLQHAYGPATDTPTQIRNLAEPDYQVRAAARERLAETIYHQGSLYPAAAAAAPFLITLLEEESLPDKGELINLLARVAAGRSWHATHQHLIFFEKERDTPQFQEKVAEEQSWVGEVREIFQAQGEVFINLLADPEPRIRLAASHLLLCLPELQASSVPALQARLEVETESEVRANIFYVLSGLDRQGQRTFFEQAWSVEPAPLARLVALSQYVLQAKAEAAPEALDQLLNSARTAEEELIQSYNRLPSASEFLSDMAVPLLLASPSHGQEILPWFVEQVEQRRMVTETCATGLLAVALYRGGQRADLGSLNDDQKRAVLAVARMAWPGPQRVFVNMVGVLRKFGLPENPDELSAVLEQPVY